MTPSGRYPRYRAPQGDGEILCVPAEAELPALVARNRPRQELVGKTWLGHSLAEIARDARREILTAATDYTRQYMDVSHVPDAQQPFVLTGHQPELFHPGVWLKNFEAGWLASSSGGTAINLIIDSDLCRSPTVRTPTGHPQLLRAELVPFDRADHELPFEERTIADRALWGSFGNRVTEMVKPLVSEPLIQSWWPRVLGASERTANLGQALSQARHQGERHWGMRTLELPQSHVCRTSVFRFFALQIFERASDFRAAHNRALADYRRAHRIRNHAQPVPNLAERDGWVETPFWLWRTNDPHRRAVQVRRRGTELELSDHHGFLTKLSTYEPVAMEQLSQLETQGVKLRTRALTTTMFARLLLADVFIHGIGGAKYDQVTENICAAFFGVELPTHATVSGTLRLPLATPPGPLASVADLRKELREHRFHPEKYRDKMSAAPSQAKQIDDLISKKHEWINQPKTHENAARRHAAIVDANHQLQELLGSRREVIERDLTAARAAVTSEQLRVSREYAYCLFPETLLRNFFRV